LIEGFKTKIRRVLGRAIRKKREEKGGTTVKEGGRPAKRSGGPKGEVEGGEVQQKKRETIRGKRFGTVRPGSTPKPLEIKTKKEGDLQRKVCPERLCRGRNKKFAIDCSEK